MNKVDVNKFDVKILILMSFILFITKIIFTQNIISIIVNIAVDVLILFLFFKIFKKIGINSNNKYFKFFSYIFYYLIQFVNFIFFFFSSVYINEMRIMKYSVFDVSFQTALFAINQIIKPIYFLYLFLIIFLIVFIAYKINLKKLNIYLTNRNKRKLRYIFYIFILFSGVFFGAIVNPYITTVSKVVKESFYLKVEINETQVLENNFNEQVLNKSLKNYNYDLKNNKSILVFVYEQTEARDFDKFNLNNEENNFFNLVYNRTHKYNNYYTNVQDSRTAIWTMLTSIFIPYESYIYDWNKKYGIVLYENNLVDFFNFNDYKTISFVSSASNSLILDAHKWDEKYKISDLKIENSSFFCPHEFKYEKACEDKIVLEDLKQILMSSVKNEEKLFLLQEFIYGHGQVYLNEIGKSRSEYYNEYLFELYSFLVENNLTDYFTIIVTADHGEKGGFEKQQENYRIPFLIIDDSFENQEINDVYTHLDFKDILLEEVFNISFERSNFSFIMGETNTNEMAYISGGSFFAAKIKSDNDFLVSSKNINEESVENRLVDFLSYRKYFEKIHENKNYYCENC